jgi:hypothetical protein
MEQMKMITFTHETTRYTVKPENAQAYRALAAKPPKIKIKVDSKHNAMRRDYPISYAGMTTRDYLTEYAAINGRLQLKEWLFDYADRAAPMLDATTPEVLEELDADYVAPLTKAKPFKATAAQLRAALMGLVEAVESGGDTTGALMRAKAFL